MKLMMQQIIKLKYNKIINTLMNKYIAIIRMNVSENINYKSATKKNAFSLGYIVAIKHTMSSLNHTDCRM